MKTICRPALVDRDAEAELDREIRAARWVHHRLLDFEAQHQAVIDAAADAAAPGIVRVARALARLRCRVRRAARSTGWAPPLHEAWRESLSGRLANLRRARNADQGYKGALRWDREAEPTATIKACRRKAGEDEESFAARQAAGKRRSRREAWRIEEVYPQRRCHWSTFNALCRSVDQSRGMVIAARTAGTPADLQRPRWDDAATLHYEPGAWRIVDRGPLWWTIEICTHERRVVVRAKCGNWHDTTGCEFKTAKLTRIKDGRGWRYSLSLCVDIPDEIHAGTGIVALDWGHREHGHPEASDGIRAWTWLGDDEERGVICLPAEVRECLDRIHDLASRIDTVWEARRQSMALPDRSRQGYRSRLMRSGCQSEEESSWLTWETRYERRIQAARNRVTDLRAETYRQAIRALRQRYSVFIVEDETGRGHRKLDTEEQTRHRKRENRDATARYDFVHMCEQSGATVVRVPSRNSTRECPDCGHLDENTAELLVACSACGVVRDKDHGAARVILRRGIEALAIQDATARNHTDTAE